MNDSINVFGNLNIVLKDKTNNVKQEVNVPNLVVASGKAYIAKRMANPASSNSNVMSQMAIGSGTGTPVTSDVTLGTETGRVALTSNTSAPSGFLANTIQYQATFGAGVGTGSVSEAGIFTQGASDNGTMLCRTSFTPLNKLASDSISITWNITVA